MRSIMVEWKSSCGCPAQDGEGVKDWPILTITGTVSSFLKPLSETPHLQHYWLQFIESVVICYSLSADRLFCVCLLSHSRLTYDSFEHLKKAPNLRDEPLLCLHITDNFTKNQFKILSWGILLPVPVALTHNLFLFLFSWIYEKYQK